MEYKPPGPPPKTGKHRYVFLDFVPANGTSQPLNLTKPSDRQHWGTGKEREGVRHWEKENGLVPVGKCTNHSLEVKSIFFNYIYDTAYSFCKP